MVLEAEVDTESRKEGLHPGFGAQGDGNLGRKHQCTIPKTRQEGSGELMA